MKPYRVNARDVPLERELPASEGWIEMQVQFLVGEHVGSSELMLGRTVLPPGARHSRHRHPNADEFLFVVTGHGVVYTDAAEEPAGENDVVLTPAGHWHGFDNTSDEDVLLLWGWRGAGSLEAAGYELPPEDV